MIHLLLKRNEVRTLQLLLSLAYQPTQSVDKIESEIFTKKASLNHPISQINAMADEFGYGSNFCYIEDSIVNLSDKNRQHSLNVLHGLCLKYIQQSFFYKIISYFEFGAEPSKNQITEELHISESYLMKIISQINVFLNPTNIAIHSRKKKFSFTNSPPQWIYLNLLLHRFLFFVPDLPPHNNKFSTSYFQLENFNNSYQYWSPKFIETELEALPNERFTSFKIDAEIKQLLLALHMSYQGCDLLTEEPSNRDLFITLYKIILCETDITHPKLAASFINNAETLVNDQQPNTLLKDARLITSTLFNEFNLERYLNTDFEAKVTFDLILKILKIAIFEENLDLPFKINPIFFNTQLESNIAKNQDFNRFIDKLVADPTLSSTSISTLTKYREDIIEDWYCFINSTIRSQLTIAITIEGKQSQKLLLKNQISHTFSSKQVAFVNDLTSADVIISDQLFRIPPTKSNHFFLVNTSDNTQEDLFEKVMRFILSAILEKNKRGFVPFSSETNK